MNPRVYLGGSMGHTTWRETIAIPALDAAKVDYFNPQLPFGAWTEQFEAVEIEQKGKCDVLLWCIAATTRGVTSVAETVFYISEKRPIAIAMEMIPDHCLIDGREVTPSERDDLNRGRIFLRTTAAEKAVPVFSQIIDAVEYAIHLCKTLPVRLTTAEIVDTLRQIECRDYRFIVTPTLMGTFLELEAAVKDVRSGDMATLRGRKWLIEPDSSKDDLLRTAFKAILTWEEHELREEFRFDGIRVFGPHFSMDRSS